MNIPDTSQPLLAVLVDTLYQQRAMTLADTLSLPAVSLDTAGNYRYTLQFHDNGLCLQPMAGKTGPVRVDFEAGAVAHRRQFGGGELIIKAMGSHKHHFPTVVDATAGLGRDSFVLASRGYPVTLLERSAVIYSLLADGLARAGTSDNGELVDIVSRMTLVAGDAKDYLSALSEQQAPDIIYLDPMFPESKKSALVKKEMQAFQAVVGADEGADSLLELALSKAIHRVVVKRPAKAPFLAQCKPSHSVTGKAVRFDIYALKAFAK